MSTVLRLASALAALALAICWISKLSTALNEAIADPKLKSRIVEVGAIPKASTPEQYGKMIEEDQLRPGGDLIPSSERKLLAGGLLPLLSPFAAYCLDITP